MADAPTTTLDRPAWVETLAAGDALHARGMGAGVVESCNADVVVLRIERRDMTLRLPVTELVRRARPIVPASRMRDLLVTLGDDGRKLRPTVQADRRRMQALVATGNPEEWVALLRDYAAHARRATLNAQNERVVPMGEQRVVRELVEALADELSAGRGRSAFDTERRQVRELYDAASRS